MNENENTNSRSIGDISQIGLYHWEIRDLGSNFSHETRICEAAGVLAIQEKFFYSVVLYRMVTSSNATKAVWIRSIACLISSSCKVASLFKKRIE